MDSRNVNFSIKKSQIHTHMLSLSQKLTKLDIAWTSVAWDSGSGSQKMALNELLFTFYMYLPQKRHLVITSPSPNILACLAEERGAVLKFGGISKLIRLRISSEKIHKGGALSSISHASTYLHQLWV